MDRTPLRILIVEDDEDDYLIARRLLSKARSIQCEPTWVDTYDEGLLALTTNAYDAALVDYRLGPESGLQLLRTAVDRGCATPIILLTGQGDLDVDLMAMEAGAADYLVKGEIDAPLVERSIRYAIERHKADRRIREQAALLDKARDAISAYDLDGRVTFWNQSAERLTGWKAGEVVGRNIDDWLYDTDDARLEKARARVFAQGEWTGELHQRTRGGEAILVESRWTLVRDPAGAPQAILVINTDITERKQLEAQFLQAQRMESIGRLVSGIAHDLGNLLIPILLGVKVLQKRHGDDPRSERTLRMIENGAERGADMVKQVLAFARGVDGERKALEVAEVVDEVARLVDETFPGSIGVEVQVADELWSVLGDATQLQQVLMNLCVNARDAMPDGGTLTVTAENAAVDAYHARRHLEAAPGTYVRLSVTDTGTGIPADEVAKIFEPFFTTKPTGKGTGLGLSTVYTILKSHGGFVTVYSEAGEGTTFNVYLPVADADVQAPAAVPPSDVAEGDGELVLIVDDEADVLAVTREILTDARYDVVTATNGARALEQLDAHPDVALILTDLSMPEMDGLTFIRTLRARGEGRPIVAASGIAGERTQVALDAGATAFLPKPYTADRLCAAVHDALHAVQARA